MSKSFDKKLANTSVFTDLLDWGKVRLHLSPANVLAALIVLVTTVEVIENCIHVNQSVPGVLAIPFIACLDILFIILVASLFVRRPNGFIMYLGFVAILIVPNVASIVLIDLFRSLSGVHNVPAATSRLLRVASSWY